MTGRWAGFCGGATEDDFVKAAGGRGFGFGPGGGRMRGRGGGRGFGFGQGRAGRANRRAVDPDDSPGETESPLKRVMDRLEAMEKRLAGLEPKD